MIDYGYLKSHNQSTLQSVMKHKKNNLLENLGRADITSHVNFELLSEFFLKKKFKVKNIITQKQFLEKMGIIERAKVLSKNMKFKEQSDLYLRLERLLSPTYMGNLFKVFLAYKWSKKNWFFFKQCSILKNLENSQKLNIAFFQEKMVILKEYTKA